MSLRAAPLRYKKEHVDLLVMICCSQGWIETAEAPGIINWMDYALERNPNTRFALAMP